MKYRVDYGREGLEFDLPRSLGPRLLKARPMQELKDAAGALRRAMEQPIGSAPLADLCHGKRTAAIAVSDHTRPLPGSSVLPALVEELTRNGIDRNDITIVVATGLHRATTQKEAAAILGEGLERSLKVVSHDARRTESLCDLGRLSNGAPLGVARAFVEADLRLAVSLVEPHFFAGYSGGRKMVLPGLAARETIFSFHSPSILAHPRVRSGCLEGNPVHQLALEAARKVGVHFSVNLTIDERQRPTGIFAGDLEKAHLAAVEFGDRHWRCAVKGRADVVVTSGGGAPLDATFYQTVKGISAALPVLRDGGTIVVASECAEGLGSPQFIGELGKFEGADQYLDLVRGRAEMVVDQWQLQKLAEALQRARVVLVSALKANPAPVARADSIERALENARAQRLYVIPSGPYLIAEVEDD